MNNRNSPPEMFLGKDVLKICSKFTGEHSCRSMISIKLLCNFIEITLWHGCSLVNSLYILRALFWKNTYEGLLLFILLVEIAIWILINLITFKKNLLHLNKYAIWAEWILSMEKNTNFLLKHEWCSIELHLHQQLLWWKNKNFKWIIILFIVCIGLYRLF